MWLAMIPLYAKAITSARGKRSQSLIEQLTGVIAGQRRAE
jgi:hypothetical protein